MRGVRFDSLKIGIGFRAVLMGSLFFGFTIWDLRFGILDRYADGTDLTDLV